MREIKYKCNLCKSEILTSNTQETGVAFIWGYIANAKTPRSGWIKEKENFHTSEAAIHVCNNCLEDLSR